MSSTNMPNVSLILRRNIILLIDRTNKMELMRKYANSTPAPVVLMPTGKISSVGLINLMMK